MVDNAIFPPWIDSVTNYDVSRSKCTSTHSHFPLWMMEMMRICDIIDAHQARMWKLWKNKNRKYLRARALAKRNQRSEKNDPKFIVIEMPKEEFFSSKPQGEIITNLKSKKLEKKLISWLCKILFTKNAVHLCWILIMAPTSQYFYRKSAQQ